MQQEVLGPHALRDIPEAVRENAMTEHLRAYHERYRDALIEMAASARDKAVSHREKPFQVGSAVLTVDQTPGKHPEYEMYASHNWTPTPGKRLDSDKRCAERNVLDGALLTDSKSLVVAITTVSRETSTGDETTHDVLHPCQECRTLLRQLIAQGNLRQDSVICSVNDATATDQVPIVIEEKTIREVLDLYPEDQSAHEDSLSDVRAA